MGFLFKQTDDPAIAELHVCDQIGYGDDGRGSDAAREFNAQLAGLLPVREINVRINSTGGHGHIAIGIHDALRRCGARVVTSIEGFAMSAAATVAQAGSVRRMAADAVLHAHDCLLRVDTSFEPSGVLMLTAAELRRCAALLDQMTERIACIFAERSGRSKADVRAMFAADDCMNAEEAKAWGLVDEIIPPRRLPAAHDQDWQTRHFAPKVRACLARRAS
jgi:ATP-dependent protease ClpP protease subunit